MIGAFLYFFDDAFFAVFLAGDFFDAAFFVEDFLAGDALAFGDFFALGDFLLLGDLAFFDDEAFLVLRRRGANGGTSGGQATKGEVRKRHSEKAQEGNSKPAPPEPIKQVWPPTWSSWSSSSLPERPSWPWATSWPSGWGKPWATSWSSGT